MLIYYNKLDSDQTQIQTSFDFEEFGEKYKVNDFSGTLFKTDGGYYLTGKIKVDAEYVCDRCLGTYNVHTENDISVNIHPGEESSSESEYEMQDIDGDTYQSELEYMDLHDILRQEVVLQTPIKKLCSDSCKNSKEQNSFEEKRTPLSGLAKLKEKIEEK